MTGNFQLTNNLFKTLSIFVFQRHVNIHSNNTKWLWFHQDITPKNVFRFCLLKRLQMRYDNPILWGILA